MERFSLTNLDVTTFGEAMAMFIAEEPGPLHEVSRYYRELAGAEINVAIGLARLGLKSGWASKVGDDSFGKFVMERLKNENVDTSCVVIDDKYPTGFQIKSKVLVGDPEVQYFRKGSAASYMRKEEFKENFFLNSSHVHLTGIPLAISKYAKEFASCIVRSVLKKRIPISFDPNLRPALWNSEQEMISVVNDFAFKSNFVLPGLKEGRILTGYEHPRDIASFYLDHGVEAVIVKLGEKGTFYKTSHEEGQVDSFPVERVVDTVGAGDGFSVGFISALFENLSIYESVRRGNAIGALAVQSYGDYNGYPTKQQLDNFMAMYTS